MGVGSNFVMWYSISISKCSFIIWLALKDRLLTKDRMTWFGINVDPECVLCKVDNETSAFIHKLQLYLKSGATQS